MNERKIEFLCSYYGTITCPLQNTDGTIYDFCLLCKDHPETKKDVYEIK